MIRPAFPFTRDLAGLRAQRFDLLVIGGGIYGAWAALDAAQRGLKVALIEQDDWGSGTSQSSSKLIHGGLRYLEHYKFGLVQHSLRERRILSRIAPHLVRPLDFMLPVFQSSRVGPFMLSCGLTLYDVMAGFSPPVQRHRYYRPAHLHRSFPFLENADLVGAFRYGDCQEDDARMTLAVAAAAHSHGAVCANGARAVAISADDRPCVTVVADEVQFQIEARAVLNAAGPWAMRLMGRSAPEVELIKGTHIVMPAIAGVREAFLLTAEDGRVFFVIPWYGRTLVGTTERLINTVEEAQPTEDEIAYLLRAVALAMPGLGWQRADVISAFAGTRTLQKASAESLSAVSREFAVVEPQPNVWVSVGGKYTTARCDAAGIVDQIANRLSCVTTCKTHITPLPGTPRLPFTTWLGSARAELIAAGVDPEAAYWCALRHGTRIDNVIDLIGTDRALALRIHKHAPFLNAEVVMARRDEMARCDEDVLRRRMPLHLIAGNQEGALN